jgi:tripartite-type tricarboxylate transporter receptor subunit TctC
VSNKSFKSLAVISALVVWCCFSIEARSQSYPAKPITMIIPSVAGSGLDVVARRYVSIFQESIAQPFVMDNRPGAGNSIGTIAAAKAAPDGYTLLFVGGDSMSPMFDRTYPNILEAMTPVIGLAKGSFFLVTSTSAPGNMPEFIRFVKASPGKYNYATVAVTQTLPVEVIKDRAQIDLLRVPYKSISQVAQGFIQGDVLAYASIPAGLEPALTAGKARLLVYLDSERNPLFPDVPAASEVGLGDIQSRFTFAVWAPIATPPQIISYLNTAFNKAVTRPEIETLLKRQGALPVGGPPQVHADSIKASQKFYVEAIRIAKFVPD